VGSALRKTTRDGLSPLDRAASIGDARAVGRTRV
jgi:hypothetical protein